LIFTQPSHGMILLGGCQTDLFVFVYLFCNFTQQLHIYFSTNAPQVHTQFLLYKYKCSFKRFICRFVLCAGSSQLMYKYVQICTFIWVNICTL